MSDDAVVRASEVWMENLTGMRWERACAGQVGRMVETLEVKAAAMWEMLLDEDTIEMESGAGMAKGARVTLGVCDRHFGRTGLVVNVMLDKRAGT